MPKPTGFRAMTPGLYNASEMADLWGPQTAVCKSRAHTAFNCATKLLGLRAHLVELMNKLISFSHGMDWETDSRPLVWPDNLRLLEQCSIGSLPALKRALRALAEAGLIAFKDSPTGRRIGKRNPHNNKIMLDRTFGIDLSPLGVRTPELEMLAADERKRQQMWRDTAQQFTRDRRRLVSTMEAGRDEAIPGPWESCKEDHDAILSARQSLARGDLEGLVTLHERLLAVLERANTAYARAAEDILSWPMRTPSTPSGGNGSKSTKREHQTEEKMSPEGATSEPLIQNTSQRNIPTEYRDRSSANAEQLNLPGTGFASENGFRNKGEHDARAGQDPQMLARPVDSITLMHLCPEFALCVTGNPTWSNIFETADRVVRQILKVPDSTWRTACRLLGRERAAIALALIYEKQVEELIDSPGAYLNGMLDKAQNGKLDLPSSLFHWRKPRKNAARRAENAKMQLKRTL